MNSDKRSNIKNNLKTIAAIGVMLLIAAAVIISVKGLPFDFSGARAREKLERQEAQEKLLGEWVSTDNDDFVIDVWRDGDGKFHALINRSEAEGDVDFWEIEGVWHDNINGFSYGDCLKTHVSYDDDGSGTQEEIYTDGSGSIYYDDGLVWEDRKEDAGSGIIFEYSGEY